MSVGLIQSLVGFLEAHLAALGTQHRCPPSSFTVRKEVDSGSDHTLAVPEQNAAEKSGENNGDRGDEADVSLAAAADDSITIGEKEVVLQPVGTDNSNNKEQPASAAVPPGPVFRITSPSYQAVQHELERFRLLRESHAAATDAMTPFFPGSPRSICLSPDRSPLSLSCGYSPERSLLNSPASSGAASPVYSPEPFDFSPTSSPPCSPGSAGYSPIPGAGDPSRPWRGEEETFSDEFDSGEHVYYYLLSFFISLSRTNINLFNF